MKHDSFPIFDMAVKYVSNINRWTWTEGVREEISEENFWIWERGIYRRVENLLSGERRDL
jgi:hypothetical protein